MSAASEPATGPTIGRTTAESVPYFPPRPKPAGAPNVIVILLDDVGFGQLGSFGAPIETPAMDRLAADGIRFNRFHVTALCSPSRAALLTGRNHHRVGMGFLSDIPVGFPGYSTRIPKSAATLARVLRDGGYNTFAVGKWHLTPRADRSASGPFDTWPLGMGFERYYGFLHGDANHWAPNLVADNHVIEPPRGPDDGYHLTEDLADQALRLVVDQHHATPDKPFFLYFATGAAHAPHHVAPEWADHYRGRFDAGWERGRAETFDRQVDLGVVPESTILGARPPWIDDWSALDEPERRLYARFQEVFAGFMSHTDAQIGRLLDGLEQLGILDDTIVMLMSDNGASAEGGRIGSVNEHRFAFGGVDVLADNLAAIDELGGRRAYNHYPWGWAWAGNTPFRLWKRYSWLGGTRTPLIVRGPGISADAGAVRSQFCHIIDLFPTVLDLCGIDVPAEVDGVEQLSLDGVSLRPVLEDGDAPEVRASQYFEMLGSRSIYLDGWKATTDHVSKGVSDERFLEGSRDLEEDRWSLYDLTADFSEAVDVADEHPDVLAAPRGGVVECGRGQPGPPHRGRSDRASAGDGTAVVAPAAAVGADPRVRPTGRRVRAVAGRRDACSTAHVDGGRRTGLRRAVRPRGLDERLGPRRARRPPVVPGQRGRQRHRVDAPDRLPPGEHTVGFRYHPHPDGGSATLLVDAVVVAAETLPDGMGASGAQIGGRGSPTWASTPASRSPPTTSRRSRGTASSTASSSTPAPMLPPPLPSSSPSSSAASSTPPPVARTWLPLRATFEPAKGGGVGRAVRGWR